VRLLPRRSIIYWREGYIQRGGVRVEKNRAEQPRIASVFFLRETTEGEGGERVLGRGEGKY